jgi:putative flippase GtrA
MLFLLRKRYPYLGIVVGTVLIVAGETCHGVTLEVAGAVALAVGIVHSVIAWRKSTFARRRR